MRQKRAKAYKKQMATYERTFGFRAPYQVLLTADFLTAARGFHLDAIAGLKRTLQGDIKVLISQCCIKQLYDADDQTEIRLAKTLERRRCGHVDAPESPHACLVSCVGPRNKNRYIVATQEPGLRGTLRDVPGCPLVYINRSVMILEPPSPATLQAKTQREQSQVGLSAEEAVVLGKRKRGVGFVAGQAAAAAVGAAQPSAAAAAAGVQEGLVVEKKKRKRGVAGPNPMSVKKPKPVVQATPSVPVVAERKTATAEEEEAGGAVVTGEAGTVSRNRRKRKHKKGSGVSRDDTAAE